MGKCATISQPAEERLPYWCQEIDRKSEGGELKYFFYNLSEMGYCI